jgi:hypothetical protein
LAHEFFLRTVLGATSSITFLVFWLLHIFLAVSQYNISKQLLFNFAFTRNVLPEINIAKHLSPKIFTSIDDLNNFFLLNVNSMMKDASTNVTFKSQFHKLNTLLPYVRFVTVRGKKKECGSVVANMISYNKALH